MPRRRRAALAAFAHPILFSLLLALFPPLLVAQERPLVPVTLIVTGTIIGNEQTSPRKDDEVLVLDTETDTVQSTGAILDHDGFFALTVSKTIEFEDTELTLRLRQDQAEFVLLDGEDPVTFLFPGQAFLPTREELSNALTIGEQVAGDVPGGSGGDTPAPSGGDDSDTRDDNELFASDFDAQFDVNRDGRFTQADIDLVKRILAGKEEGTRRADVNDDGVINSRDAIDCIKAFRQATRRGRRF